MSSHGTISDLMPVLASAGTVMSVATFTMLAKTTLHPNAKIQEARELIQDTLNIIAGLTAQEIKAIDAGNKRGHLIEVKNALNGHANNLNLLKLRTQNAGFYEQCNWWSELNVKLRATISAIQEVEKDVLTTTTRLRGFTVFKEVPPTARTQLLSLGDIPEPAAPTPTRSNTASSHHAKELI